VSLARARTDLAVVVVVRINLPSPILAVVIMGSISDDDHHHRQICTRARKYE
jgi:hypothetical protein